MSGGEDGRYDERVKDGDTISLTRHRGQADALLSGPFRYALNEQEAYRGAARDSLKEHGDETHPVNVVMHLSGMATDCDGELTLTLEEDDLLVEAEELDDALRISAKEERLYVEWVEAE